MRCNICDKQLSEKEINYNEDLPAFEPCSVCLEEIMDAAYSGNFGTEDDDSILVDDEPETISYKDTENYSDG